FRNLRSGEFQRVPAAPGSGLAAAISGRGLAVGDLDGDGLLDVVINNTDAQPTVLRNLTARAGHWLQLRLTGDPAKKSPRDATGAVVRVTTGPLCQRVDVVSGGGYGSQNDPTVHFGLGALQRIDRLEVTWPGGLRETFPVPGVDRVLALVQGKGTEVAR